MTLIFRSFEDGRTDEAKKSTRRHARGAAIKHESRSMDNRALTRVEKRIRTTENSIINTDPRK